MRRHFLRALKPKRNTSKNKHANSALRDKYKNPNILYTYTQISSLFRLLSVPTTTFMCLARSFELPIKKSENAVYRKKEKHYVYLYCY